MTKREKYECGERGKCVSGTVKKGAQRSSKMDGKPKNLEENDQGRGRGMEGMCSEV